jgi:hypothetical protein
MYGCHRFHQLYGVFSPVGCVCSPLGVVCPGTCTPATQLNVIGALQRLHLRAIPSSSQCSPHSSCVRTASQHLQADAGRSWPRFSHAHASSSPRAQLARSSGPNVCNARDEGGQRASSSCGRARARVPCPGKGHRGPGQPLVAAGAGASAGRERGAIACEAERICCDWEHPGLPHTACWTGQNMAGQRHAPLRGD